MSQAVNASANEFVGTILFCIQHSLRNISRPVIVSPGGCTVNLSGLRPICFAGNPGRTTTMYKRCCVSGKEMVCRTLCTSPWGKSLIVYLHCTAPLFFAVTLCAVVKHSNDKTCLYTIPCSIYCLEVSVHCCRCSLF